MKKYLLAIALLLAPCAAYAASGTIYIDTGGCETGSATKCSGTTDSASATVSGASATITCNATAGPGGAPGCSLTGTPDLSGVATDGSQAIFLNCATNSNQKIFFINAVDNALDLVGTTVTPTGCTASSSDWGIGGRMIYASANIETAVRAGDTVQFNNTPATKAATFFTLRVSGDGASGFITLRGKVGVRPVLETSNNSVVILGGGIGGWHIQNLELKRGGTSNNVMNTIGTGSLIEDVKITSAPTAGAGIGLAAVFVRVINCEITGVGGDGINSSGSGTTNLILYGNYIHDNGGSGINLTGAGVDVTISRNIIAGNTDRGILLGAPTTLSHITTITENTVYANGNSGLEVADTDQVMMLYNNIFMNNGNAAGEYNVEWVAGTAETVSSHGYNVFYSAGGGGSGNVSGLTVNATESTSDPQFVNAGAGNFAIGNSSPAAAVGWPGTLLGSASTGAPDIGAIQRQASGGGNQMRPGIGQ